MAIDLSGYSVEHLQCYAIQDVIDDLDRADFFADGIYYQLTGQFADQPRNGYYPAVLLEIDPT